MLAPYRRRIAIGLGVTLTVALGVVAYLYVSYGRIIDARLHGERDRAVPRVFARPLTLQTGQSLSLPELVARLNDVGYAQRARVERAGDFAIDGNGVLLLSRGGDQAGKVVTIAFPETPVARKKTAKPPPPPAPRVTRIQVAGKAIERITLDAPLLTAFMTGSREKRRRVALDAIPARMQEAVLAIEDRRFYYHPGVDPIRMVGALFTNMFGNRPYLVGGSTITQQLARNFFLTDRMVAEQQTRQRSYGRKILEQFMALILETKATKNEIIELYLNDVYLGNRGSFALHGVAEASKIYFAKDVRNLTLSEAALIAGIIQSPFNHSPFNNPAKAKERRDVVLRAMADAGYITATPPTAPAGADRGGGARGRQRSAVSSSTTSAMCSTRPSPGSAPGPARSTSTPRSTSTCSAMRRKRCATALPASTPSLAGASAARGAWRRRRWWPSIRAPARSWRSSAAARTASRSSTARQPRDARSDPPSSRSSIWRRSKRPPRTAPATSAPPASSTTSRRPGISTTSSGRQGITTASTTARSRCGGRWPCRATSPP